MIGTALAAAELGAATITVNTADDELGNDGDCSLREAIQAANTDTAVDACAAGSGADTIVVPAGTYGLTLTGADEDSNATGDLDIASDVTLAGADAATTILDGNAADRVVHIAAGATVAIHDLTIRNGQAPHGTSASLSGQSGGGVLSQGSLTLARCTITGNRAGSGWWTSLPGEYAGHGGSGGGGAGGGVAASLGVTAIRSAFIGNHAGSGGGVSDIAPPGAGGSGGGVYARFAVDIRASVFTGTRPVPGV